jgi:hypothetical protein
MDDDTRKAISFLAVKAAIYILLPAIAALLAVFFLL